MMNFFTIRFVFRVTLFFFLIITTSGLMAVAIGTRSDTLILAYRNLETESVYLRDMRLDFDLRVIDHMRSDFDPVWSPDGRYLAFRSRSGTGSDQIYLLDTQDYSLQHIILPGDNADRSTYERPRWTPDSRFLLMQRSNMGDSSRSVVRFNVETERIEPLDIDHFHVQTYLNQVAATMSGLTSPDGRTMVVRMQDDTSDQSRMGVQRDGQLRSLDLAPSSEQFRWYISATWLPDNRFFLTALHLRDSDIETGWHIYMIDSHDEIPARLLIDGGTSPAPRP